MTEKKKDVLQPVDDAARRLAKGLVRQARFAALATLDPLDGSPSVSRVSLATAMDGAPGFLISALSGHFANLDADPRCSLLVGEPGKGDPLAHPRMTLIGRARRLAPGTQRELFKARYLSRHPKSALYADFPDFAFWLFETDRASLNGGFGKAYALGGGDLATSLAGLRDLLLAESGAVQHMNEDHADAVARYAAKAGAGKEGEDGGGGGGGGWRLACIDPEGLDLARGDATARLWFETPLASAADLRPTLVALARG